MRSNTLPRAALVALSALAIALTPAVARAGAGSGPKTPRFTLNQVGPQDGGGEPSTAVAPDGTIYVSAPGDAMEFWRSSDHGRSWSQGASPEAPAGDTTVNVDASGAVYESNLNVVNGQNTLQVDIFKSFDEGGTWPQKGQSATEDSNATGQPALVDRQWVDAWIPPGE